MASVTCEPPFTVMINQCNFINKEILASLDFFFSWINCTTLYVVLYFLMPSVLHSQESIGSRVLLRFPIFIPFVALYMWFLVCFLAIRCGLLILWRIRMCMQLTWWKLNASIPWIFLVSWSHYLFMLNHAFIISEVWRLGLVFLFDLYEYSQPRWRCTFVILSCLILAVKLCMLLVTLFSAVSIYSGLQLVTHYEFSLLVLTYDELIWFVWWKMTMRRTIPTVTWVSGRMAHFLLWM